MKSSAQNRERQKPKPRLAVVSPFLDKSHGTERIVVEWVTRLVDDFEIHVYSQRVEDVDLSRIVWHPIPKIPGAHLLNFLWWFAANHLWRAWDQHVRGLRHDLVFSPGCNCLDADALSVHIVFAEYAAKLEVSQRLTRQPVWTWPRLAHRWLYYRVATFLERRAYLHPSVRLILIAKRTAAALERCYGRSDRLPILYLGLDHDTFNPGRRTALREEARAALGLANNRYAVLLVGNEWRNKGVPVLLEALARLRELPLDLLIVTQEDPAPIIAAAAGKGLSGRVRILPPRKDVEFYYAAADFYAGPSLADTFALPPAEAMACGLPVIVSGANGTSEIITHGVDGLVLDDPKDAGTLAAMIRQLCEDKEFRERLAKNAAETARRYTWEQNGREFAAILWDILRRKSRRAEQTVVHEL